MKIIYSNSFSNRTFQHKKALVCLQVSHALGWVVLNTLYIFIKDREIELTVYFALEFGATDELVNAWFEFGFSIIFDQISN